MLGGGPAVPMFTAPEITINLVLQQVQREEYGVFTLRPGSHQVCTLNEFRMSSRRDWEVEDATAAGALHRHLLLLLDLVYTALDAERL